MRIVFVTPEFVTETDYDGGLANYLYRICLSLIQLGHEPIVVVTSTEDNVINHNGIEVHRVKVDTYSLRRFNQITKFRFEAVARWMWQSWKLNHKVKKIHNEKPISIIQYASYTGTGLFRVKSIPSVVRVSSYQPLVREAYGRITPSNVDRWLEKIEELSFKRVGALFGPSYVIANVVSKAIGRPVRVIESPFILDTACLDDSIHRKFLSNKKYLMFFGSLGLLKGVALIAEIIQELFDKYPDLYFVFVGKDLGYNNGSMVSYLSEKAGRHKDRVIYLDKMGHHQLYPIITNAYAVVLPSRVDNFPNTCLEAMVHRKVVIGTKGTSFEQLLEEDFSGFLCEPDNPRSLFNAINKVLSLSHNERKEIGERAYTRIQDLQPNKVVKQLLEFYTEVLERYNND